MSEQQPVQPERHLFEQDPTTTAPRCICGELYPAPVHCPGRAEHGHGLTARTVHNGCHTGYRLVRPADGGPAGGEEQ